MFGANDKTFDKQWTDGDRRTMVSTVLLWITCYRFAANCSLKYFNPIAFQYDFFFGFSLIFDYIQNIKV